MSFETDAPRNKRNGTNHESNSIHNPQLNISQSVCSMRKSLKRSVKQPPLAVMTVPEIGDKLGHGVWCSGLIHDSFVTMKHGWTTSCANKCFSFVQVSNMLRRQEMPLRIVLLILVANASSVMANDTRCDPYLGRDYDQQEPVEKMARINLYLDCRFLQDFRFLQAKHREILVGIQKWESRANRVTHSSLRMKRTAMTAELKVKHRTERSDLEASAREQYDELDAPTAENRVQIIAQRREITQVRRADLLALQSEQRKQTSSLQDSGNQCSADLTSTIKSAVSKDKKNVDQQFLDKGARLKREYAELKELPSASSLNAISTGNDVIFDGAGDDVLLGGAGNDVVEIGTGNDTTCRIVSGPFIDGFAYETEKDVVAIGEVSCVGLVWVTSDHRRQIVRRRTPIYFGDVIETDTGEGCEIEFEDGTSWTIEENSKVEIDEYIYDDPNRDSKTREFPFLRGVFLFVSGLIGQEEPQDVDFPIGNLGIRH